MDFTEGKGEEKFNICLYERKGLKAYTTFVMNLALMTIA